MTLGFKMLNRSVNVNFKKKYDNSSLFAIICKDSKILLLLRHVTTVICERS